MCHVYRHNYRLETTTVKFMRYKERGLFIESFLALYVRRHICRVFPSLRFIVFLKSGKRRSIVY